MSNLLPPWLSNPHADYVLAAYGVAAVALIGLLFLSVRALRRREAEWNAVKDRHGR